ncbi:MAG TPA: oxygen-dependent coproporphyrinogen oxidase [Candidatus Eremiobacteraceae bacterium]|nr:oxygen-dependent coproporphyrinogen oxidase [Candidatus Eremiobacteraceae bacterium]
MSENHGLQARSAQAWVEQTQADLIALFEALDGRGRFTRDAWERPGGGGGDTAIMTNGVLFERAGVNSSAVWGEFDDVALAKIGGEERRFFATGVSVVLHPRSPLVPTVHANFRYFERGGEWWFGGGSDLTPYYPYDEDCRHFHAVWKSVCDRHDAKYYTHFKRWCDEYFYLPHRGEMRGIGGIFFDYIRTDFARDFDFVRDCAGALIHAYAPIVERRRDEPSGDRERAFQLLRRGRYVEFNLIYDRGTAFGLATGGRTESVLMSLPPLARWEYCFEPESGSREAAALSYLRPRDWV